MNISWDAADQRQWDTWHARAGGAIQQSWAYGQAVTSLTGSKTQCMRAVVTVDGQAVAIAQILCKRIAGLISVALCSRGPLWIEPLSAQQRTEVFAHLKRTITLRWPRIVFFSPDDPASTPLGTQRLRRVLTGFSTVSLDLSVPDQTIRDQMHPKWRNRLVAAEASPLSIRRGGVKPAQYAWLLDREGIQRQQRSYFALPADFVNGFQHASLIPSGALLVMRADSGKNAVAAMLFLIHGTTATYHIGWSGDLGREHNAHNLLLWKAIPELRAANVRVLDMGGVDTQRGAGIARFKIGTGGQVQTFCGTFC